MTYKKCKTIWSRAKASREKVHKKEVKWIQDKEKLDAILFLFNKLAKSVLHWEKMSRCKNAKTPADEKSAKKRLGEVNVDAAKRAKLRITQAQTIMQDVLNWKNMAEL